MERVCTIMLYSVSHTEDCAICLEAYLEGSVGKGGSEGREDSALCLEALGIPW